MAKQARARRRRSEEQTKPLLVYNQKRDFTATSEPRGAVPKKAPAPATDGLSYVIQKHAARQLHYDFRLELDGVLLSWAVPKGPSLDPKVKRLAMETEPHPLDYGGFEGTIPQGQYGGGAVMVWDRGRWLPEGDPRAGYEKGRLSFTLEGDKLGGAWHLVRTARGGKEGRGWLLFKSRDDFARPGENAIVEEAPDSALSGRSLEQIAEDAGEAVPKSAARKPGGERRRAAKAPQRSTGKSEIAGRELARLPGAVKGKLKATLEPELATLVDAAPEGIDWLHEIKFDGYRVLARIEKGKVTLLSRNGHDWTERMPVLARSLAAFDAKAALLDGEFVALNDAGVSDFQALQNSLGLADAASLVYYAFDLLHLDGFDLEAVPLSERKVLLTKLLAAQPRSVSEGVRLSEHVVGGGARFFEKASELGLEGIVSKRADAPYRSGRGRDWLKTKTLARQEFVVVGYTEPAGSRTGLGALLLGVREGKTLRYAGRVGTGFSQRSLKELVQKLAPLAVRSPSVDAPPPGADGRGVHWVRPELVAEVAFTGFTQDKLLRHPRFLGLREDKAPSEVELEMTHKTEKTEKTDELASKFPLTHPDKVLFPELGITKREVLEYYELVAERMLPHVANRPLTLVRCPNGWSKACFFQKHPAKGTPAALRSVFIRESEGKAPYAVLDDAEGLFALVQLGALEIHTWGSHADDFERPDLLVFDLDPDPSVKFAAVIQCAQQLRAIFAAAKLESFVKTTGGKGLHVCVPITPELEWPQIKEFCKQLAEALERQSPDLYVATQSKAKRRGKIFVDYLRNARGATFIAPYSTRARQNASLAVPLEWDELTASFHPAAVTLRSIRSRLAELAVDPFERMAKVKQRLQVSNTIT